MMDGTFTCFFFKEQKQDILTQSEETSRYGITWAFSIRVCVTRNVVPTVALSLLNGVPLSLLHGFAMALLHGVALSHGIVLSLLHSVAPNLLHGVALCILRDIHAPYPTAVVNANNGLTTLSTCSLHCPCLKWMLYALTIQFQRNPHSHFMQSTSTFHAISARSA